MDAQAQAVRVNAFRSKLIIITTQASATRRKIFQIFFRPDRSLFVTFPYFRHRTGILAAATIPGNAQTTSQVSLQVGGKIASHLVKYSHHPDGWAHFSQTGKVRTEIRRQSVALDAHWGHIFTVHVQGLEAFNEADDPKDAETSPKRTTLSFQVGTRAETEAIKFVGRWFDISRLPLGNVVQSVVGPILRSEAPTGKQQDGFLVASPHENARHVLYITCEIIPRLASDAELMLFCGGFDPRETMADIRKDAGFLAFLYPASNAEELRKLLGTIDR
jgi:hypothetical protein